MKSNEEMAAAEILILFYQCNNGFLKGFKLQEITAAVIINVVWMNDFPENTRMYFPCCQTY